VSMAFTESCGYDTLDRDNDVCCMLYVKFCSLWGNGIGDEGAQAIAEALKVNATITNIR
jgi:hypothetical protein